MGKTNFVYMVWGIPNGNSAPILQGIYAKEDDAWSRFNELFHGANKLCWKWLDVKKEMVQAEFVPQHFNEEV